MNARSWPGNVRELKNALAYALAFVDESERGVLNVNHFASLPPSGDDETSWVKRLPLAGLRLSSIEQAAIAQTLAHGNGNKMQAAHLGHRRLDLVREAEALRHHLSRILRTAAYP